MDEFDEASVSNLAFSRDGDFEPYRFEEFADRVEQLKLVQAKVEAAQAGLIPRPLIEIYGVIGLGKTWLLNHLAFLFSFKNPALPQVLDRPLKMPSLSTLVDFRNYPNLDALFPLLRDVVGQIERQFAEQGEPVEMYAPLPAYFRLDTPPPKSQHRDEVVVAFCEFINELAGKCVPLLIFDSTERSEEGFIDWLEEKVLFPIISTDQALLIFSGRRWRRWKIFEVRRRIEYVALDAFDQKAVGDQLEKLHAEALAASLFDYSFGHPLTTKAIYHTLAAQRPAAAPFVPEEVVTQEEAIRDTVYRQVVANHLLREIPEAQREILEPLLWAICILRKFNPTPLRHFAIQFLDADYDQRPGGFYLDIIRELQDSTLVQWSSAHSGYILHPVLRRVMAKNLLMRDRDEFRRRHEEAIGLYDGWIRQFPRNAASYLLERTFHKAWALHAAWEEPPTPQVHDTLVNEIQELLSEVESHPEVQWDLPDVASALQEELEKDMELREIVGEKTYETLTQLVGQLVARVGGS